MTFVAYVALGANLGEPLAALRQAAADVRGLGDIEASSALYCTAPLGGPSGQPDYLNAALRLRTPLDAPTLLSALHDIEARAGRQRHERWEARVLDLDLILHGDQQSSDPALTLPHPRAWERAFVLAPLADLDPVLAHPLTGETVTQALARTGLGGVTRLVADWAQ